MKNTNKTGLLATSGAVVSAIASSACCWLPLSLLAFGMSAGGIAVWFEHYRLPFLIASGSFLAIGFYLVYARSPQCEPGSACATKDRRSARITKTMLWVSTAVVIAFAAFPKYIGTLLTITDSSSPQSMTQPVADVKAENTPRVDTQDTQPQAPIAPVADNNTIIEIQGMTCEGCAVNLQHSLARLSGVNNAQVWFKKGIAQLKTTPDGNFDPQQALKAISDSGFTGSLKKASKQP